MQKRIRIVSISIFLMILLIGIIILYDNTNNEYSFEKDGIKYALTLDGNKVTSFPSKGMYKVQVSCEGANGKWLYDDWKLALNNIKGDISCNINFNTLNKTYLNDYLVNLAGTEQGKGQMINDKVNIPDYTYTTALTQSSYNSLSIFSSSYGWSTSGTDASNAYTFSNNTWTSVPSSMSSDTYYHFMFTPNENGFYQFCYNLSSGNTNNQLQIMVNGTLISLGATNAISASTSSAKSGCVEIGYVSPSTKLKVILKAYTKISTLSFSIKKSTKINSVFTGYRYEGKNPNNYIWFNNEYWRIIGVFDSASHGQNGKNLVKIIKDETLGNVVWNTQSNNWATSSLKSLLNGAYYNAQDGTNSGYCYGYSTDIVADCDYTKKGILSDYRKMIVNATWYLGGFDTTIAAFAYGYERGTSVYGNNSKTTTGYIGLMYSSDYLYSVPENSCARTTEMNNYNNNNCAGQSWIFEYGYEYVITHSTLNNIQIFGIDSSGSIIGNASYSLPYAFRPVLYLDSSVFLYDGDGSLENPYIIGM